MAEAGTVVMRVQIQGFPGFVGPRLSPTVDRVRTPIAGDKHVTHTVGKHRLTYVIIGAVVALAALAGPAAAEPQSDPTRTGCPGQTFTLEVDALTAQGYRVPQRIDAEGNNDNLVCGVPLPLAVCASLSGQCTVPQLFLFRDNDLPARDRP